MATVSAPSVTVELIEAVRRAQAAGWTWRAVEDAGGPSSTKMTQILAGEGVVRGDVIRKLDKAFGWDAGTTLGLLSASKAQRRGALTRAAVVPPGQAPSIGGSGRGKELMSEERAEIVGALASIGQQLIDLAQRIEAAGADREQT